MGSASALLPDACATFSVRVSLLSFFGWLEAVVQHPDKSLGSPPAELYTVALNNSQAVHGACRCARLSGGGNSMFGN